MSTAASAKSRRRIAFLSADLASQIAAGEVVERPSSVVKELIENSLDADARRVDVTIEGGGITLIEVSDDGVGMSQEDAPRSLGRHATSKLRGMEDLEAIASFGFRGEALPSVASVSRLSLRTRTKESDTGLLLVAEGTTEALGQPVGAPVGTVLSVRDLFFNIPARRKFLRSTNTEAGHVTDVFVDAALSRPDVSFTLTRDGRRTKSFPRVKSRAERVQQAFSEEELIGCTGERGPLRVEAHLSPPERSRKGALGLKIFVNKRPIRDRALAATIAHAYGEGLPRGNYPRGVVYLELSGSLVDVNVHPQKAEVRFADPRAVCDAVHSIVKKQLGPKSGLSTATESAPGARLPGLDAAEVGRGEGPAQHLVQKKSNHLRQERAMAGGQRYSTPVQPRGEREATLTTRDSKAPGAKARSNWKNLRLLGQVRKSFLVCEGDDGLYVLDQHAAHERVLFTELRRAFETSQVISQALLFPVTVELSKKECQLVEKGGDVFSRLGLDVRVRSEFAVSLHSIPQILSRSGPEALLRDVCAGLLSAKRPKDVDVDAILGRLACREALKSGDKLQHETGDSLLRSLSVADLEVPCPHGRVIVSMTPLSDGEKPGRSE